MFNYRVDLARFDANDVMVRAAVRYVEADNLDEAVEMSRFMVRRSSEWCVIDTTKVTQAEVDAQEAREEASHAAAGRQTV